MRDSAAKNKIESDFSMKMFTHGLQIYLHKSLCTGVQTNGHTQVRTCARTHTDRQTQTQTKLRNQAGMYKFEAILGDIAKLTLK